MVNIIIRSDHGETFTFSSGCLPRIGETIYLQSYKGVSHLQSYKEEYLNKIENWRYIVRDVIHKYQIDERATKLSDDDVIYNAAHVVYVDRLSKVTE